uniref:DNA polymerase delta subunit 3 n=1 Tax=Globodera pallida TaxID=36090 RepID=A0A183BN25_GLOPA
MLIKKEISQSKLMQEFLESNSTVSANYYLLGLLKEEPGKKHCAISLEFVFKADWMDQSAPVLFKGFLRDSEAENAYRICTKEIVTVGEQRKGRLQSDFRSLSPISQPKDEEDGEEVNEEAGDEEEMEESLELKKSKRKPFKLEQKIVSATYILRHTPLNAFQTQKLMQEFLESNSAVSANYYLLGLLKGEPGKKHCAISLEFVFKADWMDQTAPVLFKGFLRDSEAENAYRIWTKEIVTVGERRKGCLQLDFRSLSPILQLKDEEDGEEVNEEAGDEEEMEESLELKKSKRKPFKRPILFTPITKEEEKQQIVESRPCREKNSGSGDLPSAHPPAKRPMAQPIKRDTKQPKTNAAPKSGGSKQTTIFSFFKG